MFSANMVRILVLVLATLIAVISGETTTQLDGMIFGFFSILEVNQFIMLMFNSVGTKTVVLRCTEDRKKPTKTVCVHCTKDRIQKQKHQNVIYSICFK